MSEASIEMRPLLMTVAAAFAVAYGLRARSRRRAAQVLEKNLPDVKDTFGSDEVEAALVAEAKMVEGRIFPLTLSPTAANVERVAFVRQHHTALLELIRTHGAVLLRGWGPCSADHFAEISAALRLSTTEMSCSAGPRFRVADNVFTANEAPPSERIPFHHEMAQCDAPPSVVCFFCEEAAPEGGATPILQSHLAATFLRAKHPEVAARLEALGVRYVRIMPPVTDPSSALGKSWKNSLRVETAEAAEAALRALGSTWTWLPGGMLHTVTKQMPALLRDGTTGREVLFTAAESTFNGVEDEAALGDEAARETARGGAACGVGAADGTAVPATVRPIKAIIYGDGSALDAPTKRALLEVSEFMQEAQVAIPWQPGDALLLNNATVQHARERFTPPRRILASLVGQLSKVGALHEPSLEKKAASTSCSPSTTMDALPDITRALSTHG